MRDRLYIFLLAGLVWGVNAFWLIRDTRPPVWDMAVHQIYALNYVPGGDVGRPPGVREYSGTYPPLVHLIIAFFFILIHPGPRIAALCNIPATLLLFWAIYELASDLRGKRAARWACFLTAISPYMMWMSREPILDYWLSAWVAVSLVLLRRARGFESHSASILLGIAVGLGLLTKWLFAGFFFFPLLYICISERIWRFPARLVHFADTILVSGFIAATWYLPNLPRLISFFSDNARVGEREGEPPVLSFQSFIYYLRLLEGYQLFGILFVLLAVSCFFVARRKLLRDGRFWSITVLGVWTVVTLLRTKDPRFTMPLIGILAIIPAVWIDSWPSGWRTRAAKAALIGILGFQGYAINFGVGWLPQEIILAKGYQGSLRWDWNFFMQHYFHILGPPKAEDWKQAEILNRLIQDSKSGHRPATLAIVPDLARFSAANFQLQAKLLKMPVRVEHLQSRARGMTSFDGFNYVIMTESEQGMPWTTLNSRALSQIIVDEHQVFRLLGTYTLPNGDGARLYLIQRETKEIG